MRILYTFLFCCLTQVSQAQCNAIITPLGPTTFCQGDSLTFVGSPGDLYKWYKNGNLVAVLTTDSFTVNTSGSYEVVIDSFGCIDTSAVIVVTVNTIPAQPGAISGPAMACFGVGASYTFSVLAVPGATSYSWTNNGQPLPGTTNSIQMSGSVLPCNIVVVANNSCGSSAPSPNFQAIGGTLPTNTGLYYQASPPTCPGDVENMAIMVVQPGDIFTFYKGSTVVQTGSSQGYGATTSGTYHCLVTKSGGCFKESSQVTVTFDQASPQPSIIQVGPSLMIATPYVTGNWFLNGNYLSTGQYYYPTVDGNYTVSAGSPCPSESAPYNVSYTGVESLSFTSISIAVYPNPNAGAFTLSAAVDAKEAKVVVMDITGKTVQTQVVSVQNNFIKEEIKLSEQLTPGLYLLKLSAEGYNKVISFVKQ